jgi:uncharacterized protein (TIGR02646 family)
VKYVRKGSECKELRDWKRSNAKSPQNIHYDNLSGIVRQAILKKLVKEQGGLCAYTMQSLAALDGTLQAHIEHIYPRSKHPTQTLAWTNLLACVPHHNAYCDYGAKLKDKYDPAQDPFVSPTLGSVSTQFRYRETGLVEGLTPDAVATASEKVLNLNHANLLNDRRGKIRGALANNPSAAQARARARQLRKIDSAGNFEPYCEAVAQVLDAYATRLENRAARTAGTKRQ